jgi:uncharacterized SAM-binding protein YcdF (DUF218 family)
MDGAVIRFATRWLLRLLCLAFVAGLLLAWFAPAVVLPPVARFLNVSEPPRKVDCILILNGDPEIRPFAAAALIKSGLARDVLLTRQRLAMESSSVQEGVMLSEIEITKKILHARGVPDARVIVLPGEITSTSDEARELAKYLTANRTATVAIVTNAFHTRRARMNFQRALGESFERVSFIGVPRDGVDENSWWRTAAGCAVYFSEYCKLPVNWLQN